MKKFKVSEDKQYLIGERFGRKVFIPILINPNIVGKQVKGETCFCFPLVGAEFARNNKGDIMLRRTKNSTSADIHVDKSDSIFDKLMHLVNILRRSKRQKIAPYSSYQIIAFTQTDRHVITFETYKGK